MVIVCYRIILLFDSFDEFRGTKITIKKKHTKNMNCAVNINLAIKSG
jgi:hypothetical protein